MKKTVIALAAAAMTAPLAANAETSWFGFSQINAETKSTASGDNEGLRFGADRVRIGYKASEGDAFAKLQMDFNQSGTNGLPNQIKDAVVGYKLAPAAKVSLGQFKTPVGMDFNTSGKALDITKRGMEKGLVLERAAGAMLSGDLEGGFGYDVGVFNPANRSSVVDTESGSYAGAAVDDDGEFDREDGNGGAYGSGEDMAYAARLRYDMDNLHLQASYGTSPNAGVSTVEESGTTYFETDGEGNVAGAEDYTVMDFGAKYTMDPLTLKFEYIAGENVKGVDGQDENVMYVHGGWMLNDSTELVARHYMGTHETADGDETDLTNTFLGANFFLNDAMRIQANYVMAGGDDGWDSDGDANYGGTKTTTLDDAILTQFQYSF